MKKIYLILFISIVILAIFLRLWKLGEVPPSPDWDEAALGYNAYSIMLTGRDEFGKFLPVVLRSFDDYKPALYAYSIIPFLPFFGLSVFAVRLPSVIFGLIAIIATYFLVIELGREKEIVLYNKKVNLKIVALLSMFLLAISPWHLQFSRIGFEANGGLTFNILAFLLFLKGLRNHKLLPLSFLMGVLSIYTYQSEKVFTPLLFLGLIFINWKEFIKIPKVKIMSSFLLAAVILMPMIFYLLFEPNALLRAKGVSVFSDQTQFLKNNTQKLIQDKNNNDLLGLLIDNRRFEYIKSVIDGYISHYDINWLFISGDLQRHHAPFMGLMYLFELPFLFVGIYTLLFSEFDRKTKLMLFVIFVIVPIPASITSGVPHAIRTINFLPLFQIFTAIGFIAMFLYVSRFKFYSKIIYAFFIVVAFLNIAYYLNQYFVQMNYDFSFDWQYGYEKAVALAKQNESKYSKIIVSNVQPMDQSYIFFLFYLKYPPLDYQNNGKNLSGGFKENHSFDKYEFRSIDWSKDKENNNTLLIGRPQDFSSDAKIVDKIKYINGYDAMYIVSTK